jgi:CRP-like cAMP-binding protein
MHTRRGRGGARAALLEVAAGEVVCRAGQRDDLFYVLLRGELYTTDAAGSPLAGGELREGESFGQVAAMPATGATGEHAAAQVRCPLGDAKSSLGDAKSSLGDAESSLGDA